MKPMALLISALALSACTEAPVEVPLRALSRSGPVSFVCLGAPGGNLEDVALPLDDCTPDRTNSIDDFSIPHLYAMVTQPNNGEVAVVDLTSDTDSVLDQNAAVPGANFLPVGLLPTDIVSTPGGIATFVAVSEVNFEAIHALPSDKIRSTLTGDAAFLSSWPSCALPSAPGDMVLAVDPVDDAGGMRPSCDADYGAAEDEGVCDGEIHCHGDLAADARAAGKPGRYKLIVALPSEGGFAVIDAQSVLDGEEGERPPCTIERWVPLTVAPPVQPPPEEPPPSEVCAPTIVDSDPLAAAYQPTPSGLALDDRLLYVADTSAPVIHRVELPTPCEPRELTPLVTHSDEDPERAVFTTRIAVSPLTLDLKKYLYAVDQIDGSIMVYDVSDGAPSGGPLSRAHAETNPFQPVDRIRFGSPPRDVIIVQHQNDLSNTDTGSTLPVRCDPTGSDGPGVKYRTSPDFDSGAGPSVLRGVFAFAVLESGDVVIIDVDDYDAPCRGPINQDAAYGCEAPFASGLHTSQEYSCNAVAPHQPRSSAFLGAFVDDAFANLPEIDNYPALFDPEGTILKLREDKPQMRAPIPADGSVPPTFSNAADSGYFLPIGTKKGGNLDPATGAVQGAEEEHALVMNFTDPRALIFAQDWTVTYEGGLPGFADHFGDLAPTGAGTFELRDVTANFCDRGVASQSFVEATLLEGGAAPEDASSGGRARADYVQIASETPAEADPYWAGQACTFLTCRSAYGPLETPLTGRDLRVLEATEDRLELEMRNSLPANAPELKCCFPGVVEFRVRGGGQWIVVGSETGFLHHVTANADGVCRPSCDADKALLNGRVDSTRLVGTPLHDGEPGVFVNPFFRMVIDSLTPDGESAARDMQFQFSTLNPFQPRTLSVVTNDPDVQPTNIGFLSATGELVVSDGSLEGITFLNLTTLGEIRQFN